MIDVACILSSLVTALWVIVRAAMLDPLRPWVEPLRPKRGPTPAPDWRSAP